MPKEITLPEEIRAYVEDILAQQSGAKQWRQKEHAVALAKAAHDYAIEYAGLAEPARAEWSWKTFAKRFGAHGFAGGNLSQFQQALDALPESDPCHVARPKRGEDVASYE